MDITTVIFDWAGTMVDFGSFAPVAALNTAFGAFGITPEPEETRAPMGLSKRAHILAMLSGRRLSAMWEDTHGRPYQEADIDAIYREFEPALFKVLGKYAGSLPGAVETAAALREMGIKIGSTTGYTRPMMDIVAPLAKALGYAPDCLVCPEEVGDFGRPYPYMLWRNLEQLKVANIGEVVKVGDTAADMGEGKAAGCKTVGVIVGSNMLGLSQSQLAVLEEPEKRCLFEEVRQNYVASGADFVVESIRELPALIKRIGGE